MNLLKTIQDCAQAHGCAAGVCDASPLDAGYAQKNAFVPFVRQDMTKRINPSAVLAGAQSMVAVAVPAGAPVPCGNDGGQGGPMAQLSSIGANHDYHPRVKAVLNAIVSALAQHMSFKHKILVDSPTLDERAFAQRAGLGFIGRSGLLISPQWGTWFNIGLLLLDIPIPGAFPNGTTIGGCPPACRRCIDACPNGALKLAGGLDANKCISYLTQKKGWTGQEGAMFHGQLFGCDICQNVCPFNKAPRPTTQVNPQQWLDMSDADFAEKYGHTAMLWQGAALLRRNAQAAIDHGNH